MTNDIVSRCEIQNFDQLVLNPPVCPFMVDVSLPVNIVILTYMYCYITYYYLNKVYIHNQIVHLLKHKGVAFHYLLNHAVFVNLTN